MFDIRFFSALVARKFNHFNHSLLFQPNISLKRFGEKISLGI